MLHQYKANNARSIVLGILDFVKSNERWRYAQINNVEKKLKLFQRYYNDKEMKRNFMKNRQNSTNSPNGHFQTVKSVIKALPGK